MLLSIKEKIIKIKNRQKRHKKLYSFIAAALVIFFCFGYFYFQNTIPGSLIAHSFYKTMNGESENREIEIYSGNHLVRSYHGRYVVEQYSGYVILVNQDTNERIDIYGASVIVNSPEGDMSPDLVKHQYDYTLDSLEKQEMAIKEEKHYIIEQENNVQGDN